MSFLNIIDHPFKSKLFCINENFKKSFYIQSFPSDEGWPFAKYLGACGRMVAVNYVGEELWSYFNAPWEKRVDLAWQLMEIAEQLTNNDFEFALYLLDVSFDNFAVGPRDGKVIIVDAENVLVADKRLIRQSKCCLFLPSPLSISLLCSFSVSTIFRVCCF